MEASTAALHRRKRNSGALFLTMATNEEGCRTIYFVVRLAAYLSFRRRRRSRRRRTSS